MFAQNKSVLNKSVFLMNKNRTRAQSLTACTEREEACKMAFGKRKIKPVINEVKNEEIKEEEKVLVDDSTTNDETPKNEEVKTEKAPRTIKKGSKVVVSGRCFGSSLLECPMESVKDYATKILEIENGNYLIDKGWISPKSIKA